MECPNCNKKMVESNQESLIIKEGDYDENKFYQDYFCFNCLILFYCTSSSGDFIPEYLEEMIIFR